MKVYCRLFTNFPCLDQEHQWEVIITVVTAKDTDTAITTMALGKFLIGDRTK